MASKERRGRWKKTQKELFLKGLNKYGKNWVQIQKIIKTRSVAQIRSHAQKIFLSMTKYEQKALDAQIQGRFDDFCHPGSTDKSRKDKKKCISSTGDGQRPIDEIDDSPMSSQIFENEIVPQEVKLEAPELKQHQNNPINSCDFHQEARLPKINSDPSLIGLLTEYFQRANLGLMQELIRTNMKLQHY